MFNVTPEAVNNVFGLGDFGWVSRAGRPSRSSSPTCGRPPRSWHCCCSPGCKVIPVTSTKVPGSTVRGCSSASGSSRCRCSSRDPGGAAVPDGRGVAGLRPAAGDDRRSLRRSHCRSSCSSTSYARRTRAWDRPVHHHLHLHPGVGLIFVRMLGKELVIGEGRTDEQPSAHRKKKGSDEGVVEQRSAAQVWGKAPSSRSSCSGVSSGLLADHDEPQEG